MTSKPRKEDIRAATEGTCGIALSRNETIDQFNDWFKSGGFKERLGQFIYDNQVKCSNVDGDLDCWKLATAIQQFLGKESQDEDR